MNFYMGGAGVTENKHKCKYCKQLLFNLVGLSQTCTKLGIIVHMDDESCTDFEFSEKRYKQMEGLND